MRDANSKDLLREDVIDSLVEVGDLVLQTIDEPLRNFAKEYACFCDRVE